MSDNVARMEAFRACKNGRTNEARGLDLADTGAARQYAAIAGNLGGIVAVLLHLDVF